MTKYLIATTKLAVDDYYQINDWGPRKKAIGRVPTYLFDLVVTKPDELIITFGINCYFKLCQILILSPGGRVIKSAKKTNRISFVADNPGKYVVKYWIKEIGDPQTNDDLIYYMNIYSKQEKETTISIDDSKIKVYSLLGVSRQGSLYKGENLKELCQERYIPQKNRFK